MKKIIALMLGLALAYSANAFAAAGALATHTLSDAGVGIYGGADATTAAAKNNKLCSLSKGVIALVNFQGNASNQSTAYVIACKHSSGTKISGTSNDSTKIYWKDVGVDPSTGATWNAQIAASDIGATTFAAGTGWTEY